MTAHEIPQRRAQQLCKSTLPVNHSGIWARKKQMGCIIHRKIVRSQSCTSLAAMGKPKHSLMPSKFHHQVVATEVEPSHDQHQRMWNAQSSTQIGCGRDSSPSGAVRKHCTEVFCTVAPARRSCCLQLPAERLELPCPSRAGCTCPPPHNSVHQYT
jgi:hypothetical protein